MLALKNRSLGRLARLADLDPNDPMAQPLQPGESTPSGGGLLPRAAGPWLTPDQFGTAAGSTSAVAGSLMDWLQQNSMVVYAGAGVLLLLAILRSGPSRYGR